MTERPKWVQALWLFLTDTLLMDEKYEYPEDGRDDHLSDRIEEAVNEILCEEYGHDIVDDQCGIPGHRFCQYCTKLEVDL